MLIHIVMVSTRLDSRPTACVSDALADCATLPVWLTHTHIHTYTHAHIYIYTK